MKAPALTTKRARALRARMSLPEVLLWRGLRGGRLADCKFRRQHPLGPYILDFYCDALKLALEIDGAGHDHPDNLRHDTRRDAWLASQGVRVIRIPAKAVLDNPDGVLLWLEETLRA
ncbi:endonuclease domain-containing protein [Caulobacter sp. 17J65-9]|uniref:endonuclease domain-containing protein n=1 Tax=Caulobacter sp. 17J65-9 TaxID=2709382 RepID=UPI0013C82A55|nr:endonuclease domain-containing protein [Caulobacter sp. 17J65-9]NEX94359.1 endonuclease domain-containing protein [Caulobacter sp. 17J65-9]